MSEQLSYGEELMLLYDGCIGDLEIPKTCGERAPILKRKAEVRCDIVRAINSHAALIAACKAFIALDHMSVYCCGHPDCKMSGECPECRCITLCRQAIALAEKGGGE